jgi:hypothetical protein
MQTQLWESEKLAYEDKICSLESRIGDYEALCFNNAINEYVIREGSFPTDKLINDIHF